MKLTTVQHHLPDPAPAGIMRRRTILQGAAWSAPVVLVASQAPAFAASPGTVRASAKLLGGSILTVDLDNVLEVHSSSTVADTDNPSTEHGAGVDAVLLNAIQLELDELAAAVSGLLTVVLPEEDAGVLRQSTQARIGPPSGLGHSAAQSGVAQAQGPIHAGGYDLTNPGMVSIDLKRLLQNLTGSPALAALLGSVAQLELAAGALGSDLELDTTNDAPVLLNGGLDGSQGYTLADLRAVVESETVGDLVGLLTEEINDLIGPGSSLVGSLLGTITGLLGAVLALLPGVSPNLTLALSATAFSGPLPNPPAGQPIQLQLNQGFLAVDLGALLYGSSALNDLPPNTPLFARATIPGVPALRAADLIVDTIVQALLDAITINISLTGALTIAGTLRDFIDGDADIQIIALSLLLQPLVNGLVGTVGTTVLDAINVALLRPGGVAAGALTAVNVILGNLFTVLEDLLVIQINHQTPGVREFSRSALRVAGVQGGLLDLHLAATTGGPNDLLV